MLRSFFSSKPELKSPREIALMREAGKIVAERCACAADGQAGYQDHRDRSGRRGPVRQVWGHPPCSRAILARVPFPAVTCISINEQVVHGIPGQRAIREGDLVKIDTACKLNGWCADAAVTIPSAKSVRKSGVWSRSANRFCALRWSRWAGAAGGRKWPADAAVAETAGFSVVTQYVGHGIGRIMHENPQVPNFVNREMRKHDFRLEEGLVLAVEPMVNMGKADTDTLRDHWTVVTKDGLPSVHVEHTLAITAEGILVVTADEDNTIIPRG